MPDRASSSDCKTNLWVLGYLIFLCLILATGRLASPDTPGLILAGVRMHETGSFSAPSAEGPAAFNWVRSPGGRYYECHDLGGHLTGWAAVAASHWIDPAATELGVSNHTTLWCATIFNNLIGAVTLFMIFLSARVFLPLRSAVGVAVAILFCTFFVGYCRSVFDVTGAAMGISIAAYGSIRLLHSASPQFSGNGSVAPSRRSLTSASSVEPGDRNPESGCTDFGELSRVATGVKITVNPYRFSNLLLAVFGFGVAVLFRYSFLPFATLTLVILWFQLRGRISWRGQIGAVVIFCVFVAMTFAFNYLRSGNPFDPPTHAVDFGFTRLRLDAISIAKGFFGQTFGPNRGIFPYAPWLIVALLLPARWRRLSGAGRRFVIAWAPGLIGYVLLLSPLVGWGGNGGWGPRYLVVILPVVVLMAILAIQASAGQFRGERRVLIGLFVLSALINLPIAVVNFEVAIADSPIIPAQGTLWPSVPYAAWRAIALETVGRGVDRVAWQRRIDSGGYEQVETGGTRVFPDVPVVSQGLRAPALTRGLIVTFLALGVLCCVQTGRVVRRRR